MTKRHIDAKAIKDDGRKANFGGISRDLCPYMPEHFDTHRTLWLEGWDEGQAQQNAPSTVNVGNIPAG